MVLAEEEGTGVIHILCPLRFTDIYECVEFNAEQEPIKAKDEESL